MSAQTGLYEGDRIRVTLNWGMTADVDVEMFRDCLGVFVSPQHRQAGHFTPLCNLYGHGGDSSTGYIGNFGEYVKDPVALWEQLPKP